MGTPEFAAPSLRTLLASDHRVVAVVTAPDKPKGRGQKLSQSPIKQVAIENGIPLLQPERLGDPAFLEELRKYNADIQIVVAFRMLPEAVWSIPRLGTVNLHASLLPNYRGAAPINWAIMNGEKETGLTTFFIEKEIDTGYMIFQEKEKILECDTAGSLHDRLKVKGADLVLRTVNAIELNKYPRIRQNWCEGMKLAPKIKKEDCEINWNRSAIEVISFIRGLSPIPGAYCFWGGKSYKILEAKLHDSPPISLAPGQVLVDRKKSVLLCGTITNPISIEGLQQEGKKHLEVKAFLRGLRDPKIITK